MTTRREFLERFGAGLVVMLVSHDATAMTSGQPFGGPSLSPDDNEAAAEQIGAWLHIDANGMVTVYTGKVEFGQGIRTSLAQQVAEELRVPMSSVHMVMGDTDLTPFDMGTFGSMSTPQMGSKLRTVSAATRDLLVGLAAKKWKVSAAALTAADGRVVDSRSQRSISYGELVAGRRLTEIVPDQANLAPADKWKVAGTSVPIVGARDIVTGKHKYTSDMTLPGMLIGKVVRPTHYGATLAKFDSGTATSLPGVIVTSQGDFAGVAAPT
ncbi:MAG TPA: molybdopterin cofactor-binding domain-containing protein, partial [Gemmatimonadaceae bacterium]